MIRHSSSLAVDSLLCASMNLLQLRHRLHDGSRAEMERYITECEHLTPSEFYAVPADGELSSAMGMDRETVTWPSAVQTGFPRNDIARVDIFPCSAGWEAPTVLMLHALMSAGDVGYRKWARHFNALGWNACFLHLPYHYSRVPPGFWNGELAMTADLMRNAQGLRQGVIEVRQVMSALRARGCGEFGILGTSYGGWIGALLASVEPDLRFAALMAPIVNVYHALWESPAAVTMRRELRRAGIDPVLVGRHFHLSSPSEMEPMTNAERILFVAGDYDLIARADDIEALHRKWRGSQFLRVAQGHFGFRMMQETVARIKELYL